MRASSRTPRGTANALGGINPAPTNEFYASDQTGTAATTQAAVGRDALIPPDPAAAQTPAGGYGIRPYETAGAAGGYGPRPCTGFRRFGGAGEGGCGDKNVISQN